MATSIQPLLPLIHMPRINISCLFCKQPYILNLIQLIVSDSFQEQGFLSYFKSLPEVCTFYQNIGGIHSNTVNWVRDGRIGCKTIIQSRLEHVQINIGKIGGPVTVCELSIMCTIIRVLGCNLQKLSPVNNDVWRPFWLNRAKLWGRNDICTPCSLVPSLYLALIVWFDVVAWVFCNIFHIKHLCYRWTFD